MTKVKNSTKRPLTRSLTKPSTLSIPTSSIPTPSIPTPSIQTTLNQAKKNPQSAKDNTFTLTKLSSNAINKADSIPSHNNDESIEIECEGSEACKY